MEYTIPKILDLKNNPMYNEKWIQEKIAENPAILGLGSELILHDSERYQPNGGRLDLLLSEPENNQRYEVELQLGKTDESHIIRVIEYWDLEKKKLPQYDHIAVLIAEDITSRFLNVISLFNGHIPIIAIQLKALEVGNNIVLFFTKVVDETRFRTDKEDTKSEPADRTYWGKKSNALEVVDKIAQLIPQEFKLNYNKHYIGLARNGISQNFITLIPRKEHIIFQIKLEQSEEFDKLLEEYETLSYDRYYNQYRIRIREQTFEKYEGVLNILIEKAIEII